MAFGDNRRKKKDNNIKQNILKEIAAIEAKDSETIQRVKRLEETIREHPITGAKDEAAALNELLGYVLRVKESVNAGSKSSATRWFAKTDEFVAKNWKTSNATTLLPEEEESIESRIAKTSDELRRLYKESEDLNAYLLKHPEERPFRAAELNALQINIASKQRILNSYSAELHHIAVVDAGKKEVEANNDIENVSTVNSDEVKNIADIITKQNEDKIDKANNVNDLNSILSQSQDTTFDVFATTQPQGTTQNMYGSAQQFNGFNSTAAGATTASVGVDQAIKRVESNLAKMESLKEELEEQLSDKDKEYNKIFKELKELLLKRKEMAPAQYQTIDYKIEALKVNLQSTAKQKDSIQNKLAQTNLKMMMLNQLKLEKDLNIMNKYNIDEMSMEDIAAYLSTKNTEKNDQLADLDMYAQTILGDKVNSSTDVASNVDDDFSSLSGDKDKFADLEKMMGI